MKFDIGRLLIDVFKGPDNTHGLLVNYGHDVAFSMVYQWFYRKALPSKWALVLLAIYEIEHGRPVSLTPYLK